MCKQAERDQESRKLAALIDRVKRQFPNAGNPSSKKQPRDASLRV
jgi:hypothetical protein